ncbi:hypothetical protein PVAP13_2KG110116 [Panicum virgatum]|uniref:Uncharacterized protein n=1 Tax=Panicum virgatum TaxID=38727 RepID=A0A8T0VUF5_PANVG|nr:hypothetical protein PVAP13_2KG110116 [Panicum virgatum]
MEVWSRLRRNRYAVTGTFAVQSIERAEQKQARAGVATFSCGERTRTGQRRERSSASPSRRHGSTRRAAACSLVRLSPLRYCPWAPPTAAPLFLLTRGTPPPPPATPPPWFPSACVRIWPTGGAPAGHRAGRRRGKAAWRPAGAGGACGHGGAAQAAAAGRGGGGHARGRRPRSRVGAHDAAVGGEQAAGAAKITRRSHDAALAAGQQRVHHHPGAPHVGLGAVLAAGDHLGGPVVGRPHQPLRAAQAPRAHPRRGPEVRQARARRRPAAVLLVLVLLGGGVDEDVVGLDVAVRHPAAVAQRQRLGQLRHDGGRHGLRHRRAAAEAYPAAACGRGRRRTRATGRVREGRSGSGGSSSSPSATARFRRLPARRSAGSQAAPRTAAGHAGCGGRGPPLRDAKGGRARRARRPVGGANGGGAAGRARTPVPRPRGQPAAAHGGRAAEGAEAGAPALRAAARGARRPGRRAADDSGGVLCGGREGRWGSELGIGFMGVESEHKNCIDQILIFMNSFFTVTVWNLTEMALRGLK